MARPFASPVNNWGTTLGADRVAESNTILLAAGAGDTLRAALDEVGAPPISPTHPIRVILRHAGTTNREDQSIFQAEIISGDQLSGCTLVEGTEDQQFTAGDTVEVDLTAGMLLDIQATVNVLEDGFAALGDAASHPASDFATAAQGGLAETALQPEDLTGTFATAAQGALADTALQPAAIGVTVQGYDADLAALAALATTGFVRRTGPATFTAAALAAGDIPDLSATYASAAAVGARLLASANLSDLANAGTARTNLGLGTAATQASTAFATAAQGGKADTALQPAAVGATVQAWDADLDALAALATTGFLRRTGAGAFTAAALAAGDIPDLSGTYATVASLAITNTAVAARLVAASNLADLTDPAAARTSLGLGTAATQASTAFAAAAHTHAAADIVSGTVAVARLPLLAASGAGHAAGLAPDPGAAAGTTRFLREDATWAVPAGGGGGGTPGGAAGQLQWNSAGAFAGVAGTTVAGAGTIVLHAAPAATDIPLAVQGAAAQTATLQEWRKSDGTVLAKVDKDGRFTFPTVTTFTGSWANSLSINGATVTNQEPEWTFKLGATTVFGVRSNAQAQFTTGISLNSGGDFVIGSAAVPYGMIRVGAQRVELLDTSNPAMQLSTSTAAFASGFGVKIQNVATVGILVLAAAAQTGDLQRWSDNSAAVLTKVGADGRFYGRSPNAAPTDANIGNNQYSFYLDEAGNSLKVRVRYSDGTYKTGTIALT